MTEVVLPQPRFSPGVAVGLTSMSYGARIYRIYLVMPSHTRRAGTKYSMFGYSSAGVPCSERAHVQHYRGFNLELAYAPNTKKIPKRGSLTDRLELKVLFAPKLLLASLRREPCGYFTLSSKPWMQPGTQGRQLDGRMRKVSDQIPRDIELTRALEKRCQRQGSER